MRRVASHFTRDFVLVWQGQTVSQLGSQAFLVATMYWTMEVTGSASLMGLVMTLATLPVVLLSPIAGTLADWYGRRTILVVTDLASGLGTLSLACVVLWSSAGTELVVTWLCAVVLLNGILRAFFQPAIAAAVPDLVSEARLASANALMQLSRQASAFVGQGLGGLLYRALGAPTLFLLDGLSFLFSAGSEAFIRLPTAKQRREPSVGAVSARFRRDTVAGLRFVWHRPGMRSLLLASSLFNFFTVPVFVLLPFYVELQLGAGAAWYGFLLAALSSGSALGTVVGGTWRLSGRLRSSVLTGSFLGAAALVGSLAVVSSRFGAMAVLLAVGILSGLVNIHALTLFQRHSPPVIRGRVLSLVITMASAVSPLGMLLGGFVADLTGKNLPLIYSASGAGAGLVMLAITRNRDFHRFLSTDPQADATGDSAG